MKKILVLTNLYPSPWEPNRATFNRQQFGFLSNWYEVHFLVPIAWPEWLKRQFERKKLVNSIVDGTARYTWFFYTPKIGRSFYGLFMFFSLLLNSFVWVRKNKVDLVLGAWAYPDAVAGYLFARLLGKKFILKVHGSDINVLAQSKIRALQIRYVANSAEYVLAVSHALKRRLVALGVNEQKIMVLYNGVDGALFNRQDNLRCQNVTQLLYVGNLKQEKGVFELLDAFEVLKRNRPNLRLLFAGGGGMADELSRRIRQKNLAEAVQLLGPVCHADLPAIMNSASVVVLPSYDEGVPNVLLEAMSCGIPVVASRVGGIPEIVNEGKTGILCERKDVESLAHALAQSLDLEWCREDIVSHARQYDWDTNITGLRNMIESSIAGVGGES